MITLGCDMGSLFCKVVVAEDGHLRGAKVMPASGTMAQQVEGLIQGALEQAGVKREQVQAVAATGRGAKLVRAADYVEDSMLCVGVAVRQHHEAVRTVLDVGGQSIAALRLDAEGEVLDFVMNDKCASGTGRFLEVMSEAVGIPLAELDAQTAGATGQSIELSTQCGVFVESEVVSHLNAGVDPAEVSAALCDCVARIVVSQAQRLTLDLGAFTLTGGVAKIQTVVKKMKERLPGTYHPYAAEPQLAAALGAALLAAE